VRAIRSRSLLIGVALLALAGCGGGGSSQTTAAAGTSPPPPSYQLTQKIETITTPTTPAPTSTSPEDKPGGAGDEVPISTQAGDITPATVRVPPFIAVKVILHSADGGSYAITVKGHELKADSAHPTASVTLSGLRAGKRYTADVSGAPETLAIVANAEPGP
jgi:hypothetical protein